jgi:putative endonuclease
MEFVAPANPSVGLVQIPRASGQGSQRQVGRIGHLWYHVLMGELYCVYIMTNKHNTVLYTGMTGDLKRRVYEHRTGRGGGFTSRYSAGKLIYYEVTEDASSAIAREKQIKAGSRQSKINLVESMNPEWLDLYEEL